MKNQIIEQFIEADNIRIEIDQKTYDSTIITIYSNDEVVKETEIVNLGTKHKQPLLEVIR